MHKTLEELRIGTFSNIETAESDTSIIVALKKFVERRVSALPMVDAEGRLVDIFAKFDVIVSRFCYFISVILQILGFLITVLNSSNFSDP